MAVIRDAARALPHGAFAVQVRDKTATKEQLVTLCRTLLVATRSTGRGARLLVNGDVDVALAVGADGVHVPAAASVSATRRALGERAIVTAAAHDDDQVRRALAEGADAALVSPIFETPGKGPPAGLAALERARALAEGSRLAVVALGGVDASRAASCAAAGAHAVAVIRALFDAEDVPRIASELVAPFLAPGERGRGGPPMLASSAMATYDETLQITTEILKKHVDGERTIRPNDHIQNDLGLDSLGVMEVVADIEDRFAVTIPNDLLADLSTVEDVAKALVRLKGEGASAAS
jgi:acyl carrier protein